MVDSRNCPTGAALGHQPRWDCRSLGIVMGKALNSEFEVPRFGGFLKWWYPKWLVYHGKFHWNVWSQDFRSPIFWPIFRPCRAFRPHGYQAETSPKASTVSRFEGSQRSRFDRLIMKTPKMWLNQCHRPTIWEWFLQPIYGDLDDSFLTTLKEKRGDIEITFFEPHLT